MNRVRNGRADRIRAALADGPLTHRALVEALGEPQRAVHRSLVQLRKLGYTELVDGRWRSTGKSVPRRYATDEERRAARKATVARYLAKHGRAPDGELSEARRAAKRESDRRYWQRTREKRAEAKRQKRAAKPKPAPVPRAPRVVERPAKVEVAPRVFAPAPEAPAKPVFPDTEAWLRDASNRANYEVLPSFIGQRGRT